MLLHLMAEQDANDLYNFSYLYLNIHQMSTELILGAGEN
jgi:hypothetical protein